jgi:hypothetical protein
LERHLGVKHEAESGGVLGGGGATCTKGYRSKESDV